MKRTIEQIICELYFDCTIDKAIVELTKAKEKCVGCESYEVRVRGYGDGDDYYGEVHLIGIRPENDAEKLEREGLEKNKERAEYERLRAKFEKQEQAMRDSI